MFNLCYMMSLLVATSWSMDAGLRDTADRPVRLSTFWGKPAVVLYEDRHSIEVNRPFKNALRSRAMDPTADAIEVLAVANLSGFNFFPVRSFALHGVREAERKANHPILIDWENVLTRPPWSLPANGSTVVVLDADGEVLYAHTGALTEAEQGQVFGLLRKLLDHSNARRSP